MHKKESRLWKKSGASESGTKRRAQKGEKISRVHLFDQADSHQRLLHNDGRHGIEHNLDLIRIRRTSVMGEDLLARGRQGEGGAQDKMMRQRDETER